MIDELRRAHVGPIVTRSDPAYEGVRRVFNGHVDKRPLAVARASAPADVAAAIGWARTHGVPLRVRGAGHGPTGHCVDDDALIVDLSALDGVSVDRARRVARVGGGAKATALNHAAFAHHLAFPGGTHPTVGVAGLVLAGGIGLLGRSRGLACDHVTGFEVVTGDGRVVRANAREHPDLFWGLRGGGTGHLGVVTALELRLADVWPALPTGIVVWPIQDAADVIAEGLPWSANRTLSLFLELTHIEGTPALGGFGVVDGPDRGVLTPILAHARKTTAGGVHRRWPELIDAIAGDVAPGVKAAWCTTVLRERPGLELARRLVELARTAPGPRDRLFLETIDGAIGDVAPTATAFGHRGAVATLGVVALWDEARQEEAAQRWIASARTLLAPWLGPLYAGYPDDTRADWRAAMYGVNASRLADVARRYDPDRVFGTRLGHLGDTYVRG